MTVIAVTRNIICSLGSLYACNLDCFYGRESDRRKAVKETVARGFTRMTFSLQWDFAWKKPIFNSFTAGKFSFFTEEASFIQEWRTLNFENTNFNSCSYTLFLDCFGAFFFEATVGKFAQYAAKKTFGHLFNSCRHDITSIVHYTVQTTLSFTILTWR